jgi:hypothetical protein
MVLNLLTVLPLAILILIPVWQRLSGQAEAWQGQITQVALWSLLAVGLLWSLQMLDAGRGLIAVLPAVAALGTLIFASGGGWPALLSGRILQAALLFCAALTLSLSATPAYLMMACLIAAIALLADRLLGLLGATPAEPVSLQDDFQPQASLDLTGKVVAASKAAEPAAVISDRPPLPPPGSSVQWRGEPAGSPTSQEQWLRARNLKS